MRQFITCLLLALQLCVSPSQANPASQIIDPDELVSQLRASGNNKVTIEVTSQQIRFCNANTLCKDTLGAVCDFGGGLCHVQSQSRTVNNKYEHHCTVRVSNCEEKPAHPKKSYQQVLEELEKTGVSSFYEPDPDNCIKLYCEDQFWKDMRVTGNCSRQYFHNKICRVELQLESRFPKIPEDLSQEEIFRRSRQAGGVKIKTSSEEECVKSCQQYQNMCTEHATSVQCRTEFYISTFILCNIEIQCYKSRHNRVDLQTSRRRN